MNRTAAVILAAGASSRLGQPKQLVALAGERLIERAVRVATSAGCVPVVMVLGASSARILDVCSLTSARVLINEAWPEGIASSIRLGITAIATEVDAAILMTCDQPAVTPKHLLRLIELCAETPVASAYAERRGVPACFPARHFEELLRLRGDEGARRLLETALTVELPGGELDIDTPDALEAARSVYR